MSTMKIASPHPRWRGTLRHTSSPRALASCLLLSSHCRRRRRSFHDIRGGELFLQRSWAAARLHCATAWISDSQWANHQPAQVVTQTMSPPTKHECPKPSLFIGTSNLASPSAPHANSNEAQASIKETGCSKCWATENQRNSKNCQKYTRAIQSRQKRQRNTCLLTLAIERPLAFQTRT